MIKHYIIALIDKDYGYPPVFYGKNVLFAETTPNREDALVVDEAVVDWYLEKAQKMANQMMADAALPVEKARKAVKWEVA